MKSMIFMFSLFVSLSGSSQRLPDFLSRSEKQFVRNVLAYQKEKLIEITRAEDNCLFLQFETTMVELKPDGFVGEIWILENEDWVSIGTEEAAY
jgi:hypothetical protein